MNKRTIMTTFPRPAARSKSSLSRKIFALTLIALLAFVAQGQFRRSRDSGEGPIHYTEGWVMVDERINSTAREIASHSTEVPSWTNALGFEKDVFTFCRIVFNVKNSGAGGPWTTDFPDSDMNLNSLR